MAKANTNAPMLRNLVLVLSLLLIVSMVDSKSLIGIGFGKAKSIPVCESVYGAEDGETCFSVSQKFNLTADFFNEINPNLVCDKIFVGEWLCVDGTLN